MNAVVDIVTREGLAAATVRRIAQELQCSPGQIHHHFASAEALRAEAMREVWSRISPQLDAALTQLPPRERLLCMMCCKVDLLGDEAEVMLVAKRLWREAHDIRQEHLVREAVIEGMMNLRAAALKALQAGIADGSFPKDTDAEMVCMRLIAASQGYDVLSELNATMALGADKVRFIEQILQLEGL